LRLRGLRGALATRPAGLFPKRRRSRVRGGRGLAGDRRDEGPSLRPGQLHPRRMDRLRLLVRAGPPLLARTKKRRAAPPAAPQVRERLELIDRLLGRRRLVLERADALLAGMIRDRDRHLGDVVLVVGLRQLVADARVVGVGEAAGLSALRDVARIDRDPDDVVAGRNDRLPIATVQDEVLATELPHVDVRPADAYPLVAGDPDGAAGAVVIGIVVGARVIVELLDVDHAEAALGRAPDLARDRVDELVKGVVTEVVVVVAGRKLIEPVVGRD